MHSLPLRSYFLLLASTAFVALGASLATAADGALEINQACASVGCFPGDDPGWPVTIAQPGSYRVTSDLDLSGPGGAIQILADGTTVDLGGFGVRFCIDPPPGFACLLVGQDDGIEAETALDVTVRNGLVQGFRGRGIDLGARGRVDGMVVRANLLGGIRVGASSLVQNNRIGFNQGPGAQLASGTGWGSNVLTANDPDFTGAPVALERNVCGSGTCTWHGPRRYYLTADAVSFDDRDDQCAPGFEVATSADLANPSSLYYDEALAGGPFASNAAGFVQGTCGVATWEVMNDDSPAEASTEPRWNVAESVWACLAEVPVWCIEELD